MSDASALIRDARKMAGFTQAQLADRLGMTQSAIAKLERPEANPTVATLDKVLRATGHRLQLIAPSWGSIDYQALRRDLALTPDERFRSVDDLYADARELSLAMERSRARAS